ncbi:hypothetical protein Tco_0536132 [Tanacetum coccineum]
MSNVAPQQYNSQSSTNPSSIYVPPHFADNSQLDSGLSPQPNLIKKLTNTLALSPNPYKTDLPANKQYSEPHQILEPSPIFKNGRVVGSECTAGYGGALNRVGNANPSQARQVKCYNCNDPVYDEAGPSYDSTFN